MSRSVGACFPARYVFLTTWTLWQRLLHPGASPLFQRTLKSLAADPTIPYIAWIAPLVGLLSCCGFWVVLTQLKLSVAILILLASIALSSVYVSVWVIGITTAIVREQQRLTYDQFCLSPSGALGANWAMCAASLHRRDALGWLDLLRKLLAGLLSFVLLVILVTTAFRENFTDPVRLLQLSVDILALAAATYVDHVQSIVLGSLVGMVVPIYNRASGDAPFLALISFLTFQGITFLATLLTAAVILPDLYPFAGWPTGISPTLVCLLVLYLTHEAFIVALWSALTHQWNASTEDLSMMS